MNVPSTMRAGDTIEWDESVSDYPAGNGYTLAFSLRSQGKAPITITANSNGNDYAISVAPANTTAWTPGNYYYQAYVFMSSNGVVTEKHTLQAGQVEILANLTAADSQLDPRSHAKKCLDAIEAVLEGRATRSELSYSIAGRSISLMTPSEIVEWRDYYSKEYADELNADAVEQGKDSSAQVKIGFNRI